MAIKLASPRFAKLDFPVALKPVQTLHEGRGITTPGVRSVFREDSHKVLDFVSDRYVLVPHGEVFRTLDSIAQDLPGLPIDEVTTTVGAEGGYARVEWLFRKKIQVRKGDIVTLSLIGQNSINRSSAVKVSLAARRLICTNGLRAPGPEFAESWKHVAGLLINENFAQAIRSLVKRGTPMAELWQEWTRIQIPREDFNKFVYEDSRMTGLLGQKARDQIFGSVRWREGGSASLWQLYNSMTEHASHRIRTNKADLYPIRQDQVHALAVRWAREVSAN